MACSRARGGPSILPEVWKAEIFDQKKHPLVVSAGISKPGMAQWLEEVGIAFALVAAVQSIVSSRSFNAGRAALEAYRSMGVTDVLLAWCLPFTAVSVIANRESPLHRDTRAPIAAHDLLLSIGGMRSWPCRLGPATKTNGRMHLPGLGVVLDYVSGSMVSINGKLVRHSVSESRNERVCLAFYLRESVLRTLGVTLPPWWEWIADDSSRSFKQAVEKGNEIIDKTKRWR